MPLINFIRHYNIIKLFFFTSKTFQKTAYLVIKNLRIAYGKQSFDHFLFLEKFRFLMVFVGDDRTRIFLVKNAES